MGLTEEEKATLKRLNDKSKEPDTPPPSVNYNLDLSSDSAWERAQKLGLVPGEGDGDGDGNGDGEGEGDDAPRRRGYFGAER